MHVFGAKTVSKEKGHGAASLRSCNRYAQCAEPVPKSLCVSHKLTLCSAHSIRLHERNQRLFVKHRGVEFIMALMDKWEEDHDFYFLLLRTLRQAALHRIIMPISLHSH